MAGKRRKTPPINHSGINTNHSSGNKIKTATNQHDRVPGTNTPNHGKKTQKTMQELVDGFDKTQHHITNSRLPRAIHKPSTLAAMDRRRNLTSSEPTLLKHKSGEKVDYSAQEVEELVSEEIRNMQEKINSLRENLSKCSHGIDIIQQEQNDIFQRYELFLDRCTPDTKGKAHSKEGVTLPQISQRTSLIGNGGRDEDGKSSMISNIKMIARKRSNELALREAEIEVTRGSRDSSAGKAKQTTSSEEIRKSARLNKARDAVMRAAAQHFRKREKSATQATQSNEIQDALRQETLHKSDSKIAQILRAHDKMAKVSKVVKSQKK